MEENEYRSTYNQLTTVRCLFEKTLTNHKGKCALSKHFCLADREGYSCEKPDFSSKCSEIIELLKKNSTFVLKIQEINGPLPHNMEIRVQVGGLAGIAKLVSANGESSIADISRIITQAEQKYGTIENLPFNEIVQSIVQFQGRKRRQKSK